MNLFADYHTHSAFSGDCDVPMELMLKRATEIGLNEIVVTDHVDYDYADPAFEMIDFDEYRSTCLNLQKKYREKIRLLMGVEVGYQPHIQERIEQLLNKYPFDFVICSMHMADKLDFYTGDFFTGKEQKIAYLRYFENVLHGVNQFQDYDVYGHLDFIVRYGPYANKKLSYHDYTDIIDAVLKSIIQNGHGIEINTSGYRYNLNQFHPQKDIVKRFKQLGGEIVTVGSDAHTQEDIASHFSLAYTLLKEVGFNHIATYEQRKVSFIPVP
ncbi:MAG: histidinol-phosphatase HisJ family protein [Bacillota bacterium]|nr:histidinol-phosphatase HisJ family protein [Bacillota bacterium]